MERVQISLEFIFRASPAMLYRFFIEPARLVRWFCDEVDISDGTFTFSWDGADEIADLIENEEDERLRFEWEDGEDGEYFEVQVSRSPVTGETILVLKDYCDSDEIDDQKQLWNNSMDKLRSATGG